jgi:CheY-like chemotaxis protein
VYDPAVAIPVSPFSTDYYNTFQYSVQIGDALIGNSGGFRPHTNATDDPASDSFFMFDEVPNLLGGKFILVIDDEASVRLGMQSLLESWGCKCLTASDANEALAGANGTAPDFIIADLRLRGEENGIDAIHTLRDRLGNAIPAVLVSGDTATDQLRKVSAAGLTLMHKPLKAVRLRALLNHEFAKARASAATA